MPRSTTTRLVCLAAVIAATPALAQSYLVAPFVNRTGAANFDWVGESVSETVRETLAHGGLAVLSREDREEAARKLSIKSVSQVSLASLAKLAESAGADRLLYGRIELIPAPAGAAEGASRGTLRVTARVLDIREVVQIGEFFETGPAESLAAIETDLAWKILRWARPDQPAGLEDFRARHPAVKLNARESYIRGIMTPAADQRHRLLTQAARLDPQFPQPAFFLGRDHFENGNYREAAGWLDRVPPDHLYRVEARFLLALCRHHLGDFAGARQLLEQIGTQLPAPEVANNLGAALARLNQPEALDHFRKALTADPTDTDYQFNVGYALWKRAEFTEAANYFRGVLDRSREDQDAIQLLGRCLKNSGPRKGDWRTDGLERLKESYEEPAPRQ
ncbi:MAG: tetratricopeptide repeat protein [Bryobacterales bacterium]|nr:tetratricopeptide repeat protein [Bryobacterales bacterium]